MPPALTVPVGTTLFRITGANRPNLLYFGHLMSGRFDSLDGSYGVCYMGTTLDICFLEGLELLDKPDETGYLLPRAELDRYQGVLITITVDLKLADVSGANLARLGIDQRVTGGDDYAISQEWSQAIYDHNLAVDGIIYPSRHDDGKRNVALFDRAEDKVTARSLGILGSRDLKTTLDQIIAGYNIFLL